MFSARRIFLLPSKQQVALSNTTASRSVVLNGNNLMLNNQRLFSSSSVLMASGAPPPPKYAKKPHPGRTSSENEYFGNLGFAPPPINQGFKNVGYIMGTVLWTWIFWRAYHDFDAMIGLRHPWEH
mmetsp:Transcript_18554/g.27652  ORF Transcript_18554/g.27652 Transcript_18554/m.27652 type:complete len:125 (+) Transcript_18554:1973-2347(+)